MGIWGGVGGQSPLSIVYKCILFFYPDTERWMSYKWVLVQIGGGADYHEARGVSPSGSDLIYLRKYNDYFIHIAVVKEIM